MKSEMRKAKTKKHKEYLSIMLIPHSQDRVRVIKISSFYLKVSLLVAVLIIFISGLIVININLSNHKKSLESNIENLSKLNIDQKNMISEKANAIKSLEEREKIINYKINQFTERYKDMAEKYLSDEPGSKTNRSGDRTERTFVDDIRVLKDNLDELINENSNQTKDITGLAEIEDKLKKYTATIPTLWPAKGRLSSRFGEREDPFNYSERFHAGIDIAADWGSDILAAAEGTVITAGTMPGYGKAVVVSHGHGLTTLYGHISAAVAKEGQKIKKGQLVARVGSTGRSTGPHLHFEVRINGTPVDPLKYLD
ncbi:MAG TPA: M23 family metallopeptidase [Pseudobacteroides sp.]|uniref:M23 family metallopeptidase n=1 Tax=Pseudobacteroides sp. TaxID=1968840 RepID=UPI002F9270D9